MPWVPAARQAGLACAGLGVSVILLIYVAWPSPHSDPARHSSAVRTADESVWPDQRVSNPGYLGPSACSSCHSDRVSEFMATRHYLATCLPKVGEMPIGFDSQHGTYDVPDAPLRFHMRQSNSEFSLSATHSSGGGPETTTSAIALIYGARGGNDEVYFAWHGNRLYELPMVWLAPFSEWGTSSFDRHGRGDFSREMTIRCIECHNTWFEHVPGSRNQYVADSAIYGVTCEVCHGPGKDHVDFHKASPQVSEPHAIVRPASLPRERLMDLCAQCHSNALKHRGPAFQYRPGEVLDDYYYTITPRYPEEDHVANQTTYLRQSRCFQQSDSMTCVTCHNPHQHRSPSNAGSTSCRQCHQPTDCTDRHHLPSAVQDDCIACHMPALRKIQVNFQTSDDNYVAPVKRYEHRIGVYPEARAKTLYDWCRTQSDPDSRAQMVRYADWLAKYYRGVAEERATQYRYLAAIDACRDAMAYDADPALKARRDELISTQSKVDLNLQDGLWHESEGRYQQAIDCFLKLLDVKPDHPMAHGKLGTTFAVVGDKDRAQFHLKRAAECDPDDPYPKAMLGWLAYLDGNAELAMEYYRQANDVEPYTAKINHQMGLALIRLDNLPEAVAHLSKAVSIDPNAVSSFVALSQALMLQGKPSEGLSAASHAVMLTKSQNVDALLNLADVHSRLQKWQPAIEASQKALALVPPRSPAADQIRGQIRRYERSSKPAP